MLAHIADFLGSENEESPHAIGFGRLAAWIHGQLAADPELAENAPASRWHLVPRDRMLRERFGAIHCQAIRCELFPWRQEPLGRLAEIIVLDQFEGIPCVPNIGDLDVKLDLFVVAVSSDKVPDISYNFV